MPHEGYNTVGEAPVADASGIRPQEETSQEKTLLEETPREDIPRGDARKGSTFRVDTQGERFHMTTSKLRGPGSNQATG